MSERVELTDWQLDGQPVQVPGTVVQVEPDALDADLRTWEWSTVLDVSGAWTLVLEGVATAFEVELEGVQVATGRSMHAETRVDVEVAPGSRLVVRCLPLATAAVAGAPRARWRSGLADNALRLLRTTLLGRMPGPSPGPPVVGPWRPVHLSREAPRAELRTSLDGTTGRLVVRVDARGSVSCGGASAELVDGHAELELPDVALWWPHTHGDPVLHDVTLDGRRLGRVGFRTLENSSVDSLDLTVNGVPVFVRGALWTPPGLLSGVPHDVRPSLELARDAGLNLLRFPGTGVYASEEVLDACDELGLLAWHELALASLDVPHAVLADLLDEEVDTLLARTSGRPSTAVFCGGSETAQQVAMLGRPLELWDSDWLRATGERCSRVAPWVASSPSGGELPMDPTAGVSHWFGVGGYQQPVSTARTSGVLFASECLALSHVGDDSDGAGPVGDAGTGWDFEDVRQAYLARLHGVDPYALRAQDEPQWLARSRDVTGELVAQVLGEWRREQSPCRGALVLQLQDDRPGCGWGLLDAAGRPKAAWWHLRRACASRTVWLVDEGLGGVAVHVSDDRRTGETAVLRVALYRPDGTQTGEATRDVTGAWSGTVEGLLGRFVDASWAYRFGPPAHQLVVATLGDAQAHLWVGRRPLATSTAQELGLTARRDGDAVLLRTERPVDGVRVLGATSDDAFVLEPGRVKRVEVDGPGTVTALNLAGRVDP